MTDIASPGALPQGPRFVVYFPLVLDALRALGGESRRAPLLDWIRLNGGLGQEELDAKIPSGHSRLHNSVSWALFYLLKGELVGNPSWGVWTLTEAGRDTRLSADDAVRVFREVYAQIPRKRPEAELENAPAPSEGGSSASEQLRADRPVLPDDPTYWFVGALWDGDDQFDRFLAEGVWEHGASESQEIVVGMRAGERIAIKSVFVRWKNLPFEVGGQKVSVMRIKATGTITENRGDGRTVSVVWDPPVAPRDWYFYTYLGTVGAADPRDEKAARLIAFTFFGELQDYDYWLSQPYWAKKYAKPAVIVGGGAPEGDGAEAQIEGGAEPQVLATPYTVANILAEGCFLPQDDLTAMLDRLKARMNLVLQGPPGTGKTWLAKRLGAALIGRAPGRAADRLAVLQFHPSLSYEDFVRGWRPSGDGLALIDGAFMEAVAAAKSEPDVPYVVVIEEINRGNPAQIFGEMLTLLEHDKRRPEEGIALAYADPAGKAERVWLPKNLYVVGTMNIADRSLALVDLALRRRFSFVTLRPHFNAAWRNWCGRHPALTPALLDEVARRMERLNGEVAKALGDQFRIGHSYVTPAPEQVIPDGRAWFAAILETEIGPLLEEYFFDEPTKAAALLADLRAP